MAGTYTKLYYHLVFSTKLRAGFISSAIEEELHRYLGGIVRGIDGTCLEVNGMPDHVLRGSEASKHFADRLAPSSTL